MNRRFLSPLIIILLLSFPLFIASGADGRTVSSYKHAEELMADGELEEAQRIFDSIFAIPGFENDTMYGRVLVEQSTLYSYLGDREKSRLTALKAVKVLDPDGDQIVNTSLWNNLGIAYNRSDKIDSALICYERSLEHARRSGDLSWVATAELNIGVLYYNQKRYSDSKQYFINAASHSEECEDGMSQFYSLQLLSAVENELGNVDASGSAIRKAWALAIESGDPSLQLRCIPSFYGYFSKKELADSADYYMLIGDSLLPSVPQGSSTAGGFLSARVKHSMSKGHYASALGDLLTLREMSMGPPRNELYKDIAECYARTGNDKAAYRYMDSARMWTDPLSARQSAKAMAEFDVKYHAMEKEIENRSLQTNVLHKERTILIIALVLAVTVGLVIFLIERQRRMKRRMLLREREAEIRSTHSYIEGMEQERRYFARELHDGVAADLLALRLRLSNAGGDNQQCAEAAERLRSTVRAISHRLMPPEFKNATLEQVIGDYVKNLSCDMDGQNTTFPTIDFVAAGVPEHIPSNKELEIYRIFQEEMTNILRHAHPTHIDVALSGSISPRSVSLTIDHDGTHPPSDDTLKNSSGIGMRTIAERIKLLNGHVERVVNKSVVTFTLTVPLT